MDTSASLTTRIKKTVSKKGKAAYKFAAYKLVFPLLFKWYSRKPLDEKLVVFADSRDRDMPDNFQSLYAMCQENGFRCVALTGKAFGKSAPKWKRRKELLLYQINFMRLYAQCRTLFLVEYFALAYIVKPRQGTDVVQLWHACGMIKRIAYAAAGSSWSPSLLSDKAMKRYPMHNTYTLVCASSPKLCQYYQKSFLCKPEIIQPLGCPRTDILYDDTFKESAMKKVHTLLPQIGDRKIILYAPTFRGKSIEGSYLNCDLDYKEIGKALSSEYVFLTKFHPLMAKGGLRESARLQALDFVFDVSSKLTPDEAICVADILISDYSSIMYDYLILERPIISYIYDIDQYISDRGIVDPYERLAPGPYVFTQEELIHKLQTVSEWFDIERTRRYRNKFMCACDGHSTERIYHHIFDEQ